MSGPAARACALWCVALTAASCVSNLDLDDSGAATDGATESQDDDSVAATEGQSETDPGGSSSSTDGMNSGSGAAPGVPPSPEAFAQARCDAMAACDCLAPEHRWTDLALCEEELRSAWADRFAAAGGLEVNLACWNEQIARLTGEDCTTAPPLGHRAVVEAFVCDLFAGTGAVGDDCGPIGAGLFVQSDCQPGLACEQGTCQPRPQAGDPCLTPPPWGGLFSPCPGPGALTCIEGTCVPTPALGEPCPSGQCREGAACLEGTCELARAEGETCTFGGDCASQRCVSGVCDAPAAALCGPYFEELPPE